MKLSSHEVLSDPARVTFGEPLEAWEPRAFAVSESSSLAAALEVSLAASHLLSCEGVDELLESAVELARGSIGLERVAIYLRDPWAERLVLRGTFGTGIHGETTDEHALSHELSIQDGLSLQNLRASGACALYRSRAPWVAFQNARICMLGEGWVMVTPLLNGNDLVGVMYNDAALSKSAMEPNKQAAAAVLANFVAMLHASRSGPIEWQPLRVLREPSQLVRRIRDAVDQNLAIRGNELAAKFRVSPGHVARAFKREMGLSLVEYRNRKRIERFWQAVQRQGRGYSFKEAAYEAGFGSYAQFNRIHKKFLGTGPRVGDRGSGLTVPSRPVKPSPGRWPPSAAACSPR